MNDKEAELENKISNFLSKISEWISSHNIAYSDKECFDDYENANNILNSDYKKICSYTNHEYQEKLFLLNQYYTYLNLALSREKSAKTWADQGLNYVLAGKNFSQFIKWEERKAIVLRESQVAAKLQELKMTAEARIMVLEAQMHNIETSMKILENVARNKIYERS